MEDWIQLADGTQLFFLKGKESIAETITIEHVAKGLSKLCRYAGQCAFFFSVAEHSALMAHAIYEWALAQGYGQSEAQGLALAALLHDASEAFLPDVPRPFKVHMPDYLHLEALLMEGVALKWDLSPYFGAVYNNDNPVGQLGRAPARLKTALDPRIKDFDNRILVDEKAVLMGGDHVWATDHLEPLGVKIAGLTPAAAERFFMQTYEVFKNAA